MIAFNPEDVSYIWLIEKGSFIQFDLIEDQFMGKPISFVSQVQKKRKELIGSSTAENLQAQIDLANHIEIIANHPAPTNVQMHEIRITRQNERQKNHQNFMKENTIHD